MKILLVYPEFPDSFWSWRKVLELVGRQVLLPPLGLITAAALLPRDWEVRLVDCNIRPVREDEWAWCDLAMLSAMVVQRGFLERQIALARRHGRPVAVGGPFATSTPEAPELREVDYLVLDEGEITIPAFLDALARGERRGVYRAGGEKPDVTASPVPRFDLLDLAAYESLSVQFSRGCPFTCEFCDIIVLYGRRPRAKTPAQVLAELDALRELGWRGGVFVVDDNFIGNRREAKALLRELLEWQRRHGFPFRFMTEASLDLARHEDLMRLMSECRFTSVFLGIETPDAASLETAGKGQNTRLPLEEAVDTISAHGLRVMSGFIVGFDGERAGAGERIRAFVTAAGIPNAMLGMLMALPNTALWARLEREGRLIEDHGGVRGLNTSNLINFVPTRPIAEIALEFRAAFRALYDPHAYLHRAYDYCSRKLGRPRWQGHVPQRLGLPRRMPDPGRLRALGVMIWRQGIRRDTRFWFWRYTLAMAWHKPWLLEEFLVTLSHNEHFMAYRDQVDAAIAGQLAALGPLAEAVYSPAAPAPRALEETSP